MARRGRKKQKGQLRTAKGRKSRSRAAVEQQESDVRAVVLRQPHRAWLAEEQRLNQHAESELGRLFLAGRIAEPELWAGARWAALRRELHQVLQAPTGAGSALGKIAADAADDARRRRLSLLGRDGDHDAPLAPVLPEDHAARQRRVLAQYEGAVGALRELFRPDIVIAAIDRLAEDDVSISDEEIEIARAGLRHLAQHWRFAASAGSAAPPSGGKASENMGRATR